MITPRLSLYYLFYEIKQFIYFILFYFVKVCFTTTGRPVIPDLWTSDRSRLVYRCSSGFMLWTLCVTCQAGSHPDSLWGKTGTWPEWNIFLGQNKSSLEVGVEEVGVGVSLSFNDSSQGPWNDTQIIRIAGLGTKNAYPEHFGDPVFRQLWHHFCSHTWMLLFPPLMPVTSVTSPSLMSLLLFYPETLGNGCSWSKSPSSLSHLPPMYHEVFTLT
jgi:hypothetical protein